MTRVAPTDPVGLAETDDPTSELAVAEEAAEVAGDAEEVSVRVPGHPTPGTAIS